MNDGPLSPGELRAIDGYWRAANYLSVGQIYLLDNPLLREPLALEHIMPRLLGHWGTTPRVDSMKIISCSLHSDRTKVRLRLATGTDHW